MFDVVWIIHAFIATGAVLGAMIARKWWTALFMCVGFALGATLAVVPLRRSMERYTAETGFDAGNAGVLFVCTIPLFPILGLGLGGLCGYAINARRTSKELDRFCPQCGYDLRGDLAAGCSECGWARAADDGVMK
jgi:hypothetical protein